MPLIRYLNGDVFELKQPQHGRAHLRIAKLEGRVMDQLFATDGQRISSVLPTHMIFRRGLPIWKYQRCPDRTRQNHFSLSCFEMASLCPARCSIPGGRPPEVFGGRAARSVYGRWVRNYQIWKTPVRDQQSR